MKGASCSLFEIQHARQILEVRPWANSNTQPPGPDGGMTPFKANKLTTCEGGMRVPLVIHWPGVIRPGTITDDIFASLDWLPTLVEIAGGPKGNELNEQIMQGKYPGIVKTKLDGVNQIDYLTGKSDKSARDYFFYYAGATPSAVRYKNWKFYYNMAESGAAGWLYPVTDYHFTLIQNIKRDPFEHNVIPGGGKSLMSLGGALTAPSTAYLYDWPALPIGQQLWYKELMSYVDFPPLQAPESYNLSGILKQ